MYPRDAITISTTTKTAGTYTIIPATTTPYTILSGTISGTGAGGDEQGFVLGSSTIYTKGDVIQQATMNLVYVNLPLRIYKTGGASTTFGVTYVPRNRRTDFDPPSEATSSIVVNTGSSTVSLVPEMTTTSYIYIILATVALLFYIFKK